MSHTLIGMIGAKRGLRTHLSWNTGNHCDTTLLTCVEFSLQVSCKWGHVATTACVVCTLTHVNEVMPQWPPLSNDKCVLGSTIMIV